MEPQMRIILQNDKGTSYDFKRWTEIDLTTEAGRRELTLWIEEVGGEMADEESAEARGEIVRPHPSGRPASPIVSDRESYDTYSSLAEAVQCEITAQGGSNPDRCWILSDRDTWHRNPFYCGVPTPHPEME